jgi:hypothetical protein
VSSNYPPGVSGNEPEIAGYPECPMCGISFGDHGEGWDPATDRHYYICPVGCTKCNGNDSSCPDCEGWGYHLPEEA